MERGRTCNIRAERKKSLREVHIQLRQIDGREE